MNKRREIEKMYYTYRDDMFRTAFCVLNDEMLAEDAVSESFVRVIENWNRLRLNVRHGARTFLLIVCRNVAMDIYRKRNRVAEVLYEETENEFAIDNTAQTVINCESVGKIMSVIDNMKPIYRDVLVMQKFYGMKRCEIAHLLGITEETVTKRVQRAKAMIEQELRKEEI